MKMKQKNILAITALTLICITFVNPAVAQQSNNVPLDTAVMNWDPNPLEAGEDGRITFRVENVGDRDAENVKVEIPEDQFPFTPEPGERTVYDLGTVTPSQPYFITVDVLISDEARDGANSFQVKTIGDRANVTRNMDVTVSSDDIDLNLANLQTNPSSLKPDTDNNQLSLDIVNNGDKAAESVEVMLDFPEVFEERSSFSTRQSLGTLQPGSFETANFNFDISEDASEGLQQVDTSVRYTGSDETQTRTMSERFEMYLSGKPQYTTSIDQQSLSQGTEGSLTINVTNTGNEDSESTRVRVLDNSDLPFDFESSNKFVGTLEPGQIGQVRFMPDVETDAAVKNYMLDFEVRGVQDSETFVETQVQQLEVSETQSEMDLGIEVLAVGGAIIAVFIVSTIFYISKRRESDLVEKNGDDQ